MNKIEEARQLLDACRGESGTLDQATTLVDLCAEAPAILEQLSTTKQELQQLLWKYQPTGPRIAHAKLLQKPRSGSSFDAGSYNFGK